MTLNTKSQLTSIVVNTHTGMTTFIHLLLLHTDRLLLNYFPININNSVDMMIGMWWYTITAVIRKSPLLNPSLKFIKRRQFTRDREVRCMLWLYRTPSETHLCWNLYSCFLEGGICCSKICICWRNLFALKYASGSE